MSRPDDPTLRSFPQTQWSLVARAGHASLDDKRRALTELLVRYRPAFLRHLVAVRRMNLDRAEELVQEFLTVKILEKDLIAQAQQSRGRFRSFLIKSLERFAIDQYRANRRHEAEMPDSFDAPDLSSASTSEGGGDVFDLAWARQVLAQTHQIMKQECEASGRTHIWLIFERRVVEPTRTGNPQPAYEDLAREYGFASAKEAANIFTTSSRMYERTLRAVVADYVSDEAEIDQEIRDLMAILENAPRSA